MKLPKKIDPIIAEIKADILGLDLSPILRHLNDCTTIRDVEDAIYMIYQNPEFAVLFRKLLAYVFFNIKPPEGTK